MKEMVYKPERVFEVLHKEIKDGYPLVIMSYGDHPCAYVGIPKDHKYFGIHYSDYEKIPIECHFGLTFSMMGEQRMPWIEDESEKELWWIGWDYGHCCDYSPYFENFDFVDFDKYKWTTREILYECYDVIEQLKNVK